MIDLPKHLDLFTGIGGFSLGARWTGYETIAHSEIEPFCRDLLTKRFPTVPNLGDVRKIARTSCDCVGYDHFPTIWEPADAAELDADENEPGMFCPLCSDEAGEPVDFGDCQCIGAEQFADEYGFPDVLTAGSPCQDVSRNGKRKGIAGERSGLVMEIPRIAAVLGIPFSILENVPGLLDRGDFDQFGAAMEGIGHVVGTVVVPAAAFGFSHGRERVFAVTHHPGIRVERLWTEGLEEPRPLDKSLLSVRDRDGQWKAEPDVRRSPNGIPAGLDRPVLTNPRLKALGNSLPPQIAACLMEFIRYYATRHRPLFQAA